MRGTRQIRKDSSYTYIMYLSLNKSIDIDVKFGFKKRLNSPINILMGSNVDDT